MKKFVLAIDQGTTGSTALLMDIDTKELINSHNTEFKQHFPKPGLVEHDLNEIWESVKSSIEAVIKNSSITSNQIHSIGITNQRETTCAFTKAGVPLSKAIVWQDRRTAEYCSKNNENYKKQNLQRKTGLPLDPYFSATKMQWLLDNDSKVQEAASCDDLYFSTIDSFLIYKLTGGKSFKTEASNASRTLLMNLETAQWDEELLSFFGIKESYLPKIDNSFTFFGSTKDIEFLPDGIAITCILGDQQAALFGQSGINEGDLKCTYGTGAFILLNTGSKVKYSANHLLSTVAYRYKDKNIYALEGSSYIAGAAVQWLRDNLEMIKSSKDIEVLAKNSNRNNIEDLLFMPFFTGIGSPYWNSEAKGALLGLTRGTSKEDIALACLEGITLSINDSIQALLEDCDFPVTEINVDGGASLNNLLLQLQANFSNMKITRPRIIETTAYGVAIGSLIGNEELSMSDVKELWKIDITMQPNTKDSYFNRKKSLWTNTIKKIF